MALPPFLAYNQAMKFLTVLTLFVLALAQPVPVSATLKFKVVENQLIVTGPMESTDAWYFNREIDKHPKMDTVELRMMPGGKIEAMASLTDEEMVRDTEALIGHLKSVDACDTARMTIGGHCMGGRVALLAGAAIGSFSAIADFRDGNVMTAKGREAPLVIDMVGNITCPVIGFFGNDDDNPSREDVDRLDEELTKHGVAHSFYRYDGAGHAFLYFSSTKQTTARSKRRMPGAGSSTSSTRCWPKFGKPMKF